MKTFITMLAVATLLAACGTGTITTRSDDVRGPNEPGSQGEAAASGASSTGGGR